MHFKGKDNIVMTIRLCTQEDVVTTGRFYDDVVKYLDDTVNYPKWEYKIYPSEDSVKEKQSKNCQYICIDNNEIVGAFVLNDDPDGKYENVSWNVEMKQGEYMVCHTLATKPSMQGRGIGRQIVEYCIEHAKTKKYKGIRLDVVPENIPARKLYEKCGFEYRGDVDLERDIPEIPVFSMYELVF